MTYDHVCIPEDAIPSAIESVFQHVLDTYAGETNKVVSTWLQFDDADLGYKPHEKSSTVAEIMRHGLLSERRFFAEFLGSVEPEAADVLPAEATVAAYTERFAGLCLARLQFLATRDTAWWITPTRFFDVERERIWIFWRRVLHTAHHRSQLTVYLRMLDKPVPSTYGPTADVTWTGADPTTTVEAASRR
jgi:uncharacterized damage-inducible protein DinB